MISVAIIEDNRLVREGLGTLLNQVADLEVVASESIGDVSLLRQVNPQVVLLDLGLRDRDSLGVAETVKRELPQSRVIVMDLLPLDEELLEFVNAGVSGVVMKDATLDELVTTIRTVADGATILPSRFDGTLLGRIAREAVDSGRPEAIEAVRTTAREREVVDLIAEGATNREIAERLHIPTYAVRSHLRNIMEKVMLHTRLQIAADARRDPTPTL